MALEIILIAGAIPVFLLTMIGESWWIHRKSPPPREGVLGYTPRDTAASIAMGLGFLVIKHLSKLVVLPLYLLLYELRLFEIPTKGWQWWVLLIILQDFAFYWYHRCHHEVRFLWAAHVNHHSSERFNLSTALRQSWTSPLTSVPFFAPLMLLGFEPAMFFAVALINLLYQYWVHTELVGRLGFLEAIMVTPSHHRVHHGAQGRYLDRNHGGIFILWDRLFGTFETESIPVVYGLTKNITTYNPVKIAFHEWVAMCRDVKNAKSFTDAWGYVIKRPGWGPHKNKTSSS
ncbi:MAG: sterol desaturase family protein [Myxococcota bacterium]|nr:sterol desaturase family protein [Myxococcota bacterium]